MLRSSKLSQNLKPVSLFVFLAILLPLNAQAATFPDIAQMLENINDQMPYLWEFVTAFAYIAGFFMVFKGIYHLKAYGDPHSQMSGGKDIRPALVTLFVGSALVFFPNMLDSGLATLFGSTSIMQWPTNNAIDESFSEMGQTLVYIVQFVGAVAFLRGIMYMHKLGSGQAQQGTFGKSVTHLVGGVLCLNIVGTANVISSTLGISW